MPQKDKSPRVSPYSTEIQSLSTKDAIFYLRAKGEKICQIVETLNIERSLIYYHIKGREKKQKDSLELSYKRAANKNEAIGKIPFEKFVESIKTNDKFLCYYSGEEIDTTKDKWAINSNKTPYIYLKRYIYLDLMRPALLEKISARILERAGYTITKEKPAF
jgi:hypothetical protein